MSRLPFLGLVRCCILNAERLNLPPDAPEVKFTTPHAKQAYYTAEGKNRAQAFNDARGVTGPSAEPKAWEAWVKADPVWRDLAEGDYAVGRDVGGAGEGKTQA